MFIIKQQGQVFQAFNLRKKPLPPEKPAKRGTVSGFSIASRRRLIDLLARMDDSYKRASFVTLTFHQPPTPRDAKAALKRFLQRCREYFPEASAIWRMEFQERGAIHFHFIFFNLPYWPQYHLQDTWTDCTDEVRSIADIRLIRKFTTYMRYISKYVAKASVSEANPSLVEASYQQESDLKSVGRFWGYHQKDLLPIAPAVEFATDDEDLGNYALFACTGMSRGHCGDSQYTRKAYTTEAAEMFVFAVETANCWRMTDDLCAEASWAKAQWFGSPAVLGGIGVPLAYPADRRLAPPTLWHLSKEPSSSLDMPPGEGFNLQKFYSG